MNKLFYIPLFFFSAYCHADYYAKVNYVLDGDTISVTKSNSTKYRIRLAYIDAPETAHNNSKAQPYGIESKAYLMSIVLNKAVYIKEKGNDPYGRFLGEVFVDGLNVNKAMVGNGYAWAYSYNGNPEYVALEKLARTKKLGLWNFKNPIDPYIWRKKQK